MRVVGADQGPTKYRGGAYRYDYGEEVGRVRDTLKGARQPDGSSWGEQRRVDESDPAGGAFTRAEFVALYGDTRVWDASRPAAHTPTTSWHAWRNKSATPEHQDTRSILDGPQRAEPCALNSAKACEFSVGSRAFPANHGR